VLVDDCGAVAWHCCLLLLLLLLLGCRAYKEEEKKMGHSYQREPLSAQTAQPLQVWPLASLGWQRGWIMGSYMPAC